MNTTLRIPVGGDGSFGAGRRGMIADIWARVTWRLLLAWVLLIAFSVAQEWVGELDFMHLVDSASVPPEFWLSILLIETLISTALMLAVLVADALVDRGTRRVTAYTLAVVISMAVASWLQWELRPFFNLRVMTSMPGVPHDVAVTQPLAVFLEAGIRSALLVFVYVNRRTTQRALARMHEARMARAETERRTYESKLQAMQARVEPQFLFNTLAQVGKLYESNAALAGSVLDELIAYLRAALPHLRQSTSTLGKEVDLARAYLAIMQARLGDRLSFEFEVPAALRDARMPPMVLLPLIDHALVYGLTSSRDGGALHIVTGVKNAMLELSIMDTGAGFIPGGNPHDLESITERLDALYGGEASLKFSQLQDRGTQATLSLPYEPSLPESDSDELLKHLVARGNEGRPEAVDAGHSMRPGQ